MTFPNSGSCYENQINGVVSNAGIPSLGPVEMREDLRQGLPPLGIEKSDHRHRRLLRAERAR